jgi:hypothetical protein
MGGEPASHAGREPAPIACFRRIINRHAACGRGRAGAADVHRAVTARARFVNRLVHPPGDTPAAGLIGGGLRFADQDMRRSMDPPAVYLS